MKILLVEDEIQLGQSVVSFLKQEGYICEWAKDFSSAYEKISVYEYECALIDITLPDGNGLDLVKALKKNYPATGIIVISARNSLDDKIKGLDLGGDDYITKPFHLAELNSRLKSVFRRRNLGGSSEIVLGNIRLVPENQEVFINNTAVNLTKKEYSLLLFFISNKNRVLTKESIAEHLWGDESDMMDSFDFIYSHIKNLRKKIGKENGKDYIQSVYGIGYKLYTS